MNAATDLCEEVSCLSLYGGQVLNYGQVDEIIGVRNSLRRALFLERESLLGFSAFLRPRTRGSTCLCRCDRIRMFASWCFPKSLIALLHH